MQTTEILRLIAATGCGIQIGGFFLLSLFHKPLFSRWPQDIELSGLFSRLYRFNTAISIVSGFFAIISEARSTGFMLAILGMSYILLLTHLLPAMRKLHYQSDQVSNYNTRRSPAESLNLLNKLQTITHFIQLLALIYILNKLAISPV